MSGDEIDVIVRSLLDPTQIAIFEENLDVDFSFYGMTGPGSERAHLHRGVRPPWRYA